MVSLFPPEAIEYMRHLLGDKFDGLSSDEQAVLVTAYLEEEINSPRIQTLLDKNVFEVERILFHLTNLGYLVSAGR
jgi:transcription initiation factor IIE alpha subunit